MTDLPPLSSTSLFEAVKSDDFEGMARLYAATAMDSVISYAALRKRWNPASRVGSSFRSEEKVDEFFQQYHPSTTSPTSGASHGSHSAAAGAPQSPKRDAKTVPFHLDEMVMELNNIVNGGKVAGGPVTNEEDDNEIMDDAFHTGHPAKKKTKQSTSPRSRSAVKSSTGTDSSTNQGFKAVAIEEDEIRHVVRESCALLTNSRPPSSFAVFNRDNEERLRARFRGAKSGENLKKGRPKDDMEEDVGEEDEEDDDGPPLFDGSVANATPGGGPTASGGGGSGTVLHLACALDSPFALAIVLAMGGDASSRHTAFRRLTVHEAACADSPECLRLLLELGEKYRGPTDSPAEGQKEVSRARLVTPKRSDGNRGDRSGGSHPYQSIFAVWAKDESRKLSKIENKAAVSTFGNTVASGKVSRLSFIATLKTVQDLGRQVLDGSLSDIEAARRLLSRVDLPDATKTALVSACCPLPRAHDRVAAAHVAPLVMPSLAIPGRPSSDADGHGNTPLHWASFKNAADCVSVLLSHRADPNARAEPSGWTPLHDAAYSDAAECVSLLVRAGADVDTRANSGATPLCFAAQEDAPNAARLLLQAGADPAVRCAQGTNASAHPHQPNHPSRFSGYTPLHYCAHYNAHRAARILLDHETRGSEKSSYLLDITDLNEKLPIHVAVARGSSDVLRELLHGGARVDVRGDAPPISSPPMLAAGPPSSPNAALSTPSTPPQHGGWGAMGGASFASPSPTSHPTVVTPVSSPVLRSMIPSRPIASSKPWNCLTQDAIDQCKALIREAELNWCPERHPLFHPTDRRAVLELLRVGKRLEQMGTGIFIDLWPYVLSFCGRGWFEPEITRDNNAIDAKQGIHEKRGATSSEDEVDFTQFQLE